jgi:uncharacterized protein YceK
MECFRRVLVLSFVVLLIFSGCSKPKMCSIETCNGGGEGITHSADCHCHGICNNKDNCNCHGGHSQ